MERRIGFPDISDIIARKAKGRVARARLSFDDKLDVLDNLRNAVAPIVAARRAREEKRERAVRLAE